MREAEGRAEVFAQVQPVLLRNGHEHVDDGGVKLAARAAINLRAGMGHRQGTAVRTVADHGIERIRDGKDSRSQRNLFALQPAGITRAVKKFLVCEYNLRRVAQKRNANQHVVADFAVLAHFLFFGVVQRTGFTKNAVRNSHLADIVKESSARQDRQILVRHRHGPGDGYAKRGDALAMPFGFGILQVKRASESFEGIVVRLFEFHVLGGELRGALLDKLLQITLIIAVFDDQPAMLEGSSNAEEKLIFFKWLEDVVVGSAANGFEG